MKVGIIGAGNIAKAHLQAAKNIDALEVVGVYDSNYEHALCFDEAVSVYSNVEDLIDGADMLIIATPNNTHANYANIVMEKNKHVLCEKPMAINVVEAAFMTNRAFNSKVCCRLGFNYRFLNIFHILKQLIKNDEFGRVLSIDMEFKRSSALTRKKYTWRDGSENMATSGALGDLGIHLIDMLYFLFSSEINLDNCAVKIATYIREKENIPVYVDDYAVLNGMLLNGIYFKILTSKVALTKEVGFSVKLIGTKKEFFYDSNMKNSYFIKSAIYWDEQKLISDAFLDDPPSEIYGWSQSFIAQLINFVKCIDNVEDTDNATFVDGLKGQMVLSNILNKKIELN